MHGAIVSLDQSRPYGTWRWGGPQWRGRTGEGAPVRLSGVTIAVAEPAVVAERWAHVLGVPVTEEERPVLQLDGAEVGFVPAAEKREEGLSEVTVELAGDSPGQQPPLELGGVLVRLRPGA